MFNIWSLFPLYDRAHYIILLVESILFGVFVLVIFYDQVCTLLQYFIMGPIESTHTHTNTCIYYSYYVMMSHFAMSLFVLQLVSIITDETPIEQMRNRLMKDRPNSGQSVHTTHTRKPKLALLREVFGRGKSAYLSVSEHTRMDELIPFFANFYLQYCVLYCSYSCAVLCLCSDLLQKLALSC